MHAKLPISALGHLARCMTVGTGIRWRDTAARLELVDLRARRRRSSIEELAQEKGESTADMVPIDGGSGHDVDDLALKKHELCLLLS